MLRVQRKPGAVASVSVPRRLFNQRIEQLEALVAAATAVADLKTVEHELTHRKAHRAALLASVPSPSLGRNSVSRS